MTTIRPAAPGERFCKTCGLHVVEYPDADGIVVWQHQIEYVNPNRSPVRYRKCRITFYADPGGDPFLSQPPVMLPPDFGTEIGPVAPVVRAQLSVRDFRSGDPNGVASLYEKTYLMHFLPAEDDDIGVGTGGAGFTVLRRNWEPDGSVWLTMQSMWIDPPENYRPNRIQAIWWTDRDDDLLNVLADDGWTLYQPTTEETDERDRPREEDGQEGPGEEDGSQEGSD